jgi:hypothetical protein
VRLERAGTLCTASLVIKGRESPRSKTPDPFSSDVSCAVRFTGKFAGLLTARLVTRSAQTLHNRRWERIFLQIVVTQPYYRPATALWKRQRGGRFERVRTC